MSALTAAPVTIEYAMSPSSTASSTPVTVTTRARFQFAAVKVSDETDTVPSVPSAEAIEIVTSAVGWLVSTTLNVAVPPASVVLPLIAETMTPAVSLSRLVTATSFTARPL